MICTLVALAQDLDSRLDVSHASHVSRDMAPWPWRSCAATTSMPAWSAWFGGMALGLRHAQHGDASLRSQRASRRAPGSACWTRHSASESTPPGKRKSTWLQNAVTSTRHKPERRMASWLAGWLAGWMAGWLVGWLRACVRECVRCAHT